MGDVAPPALIYLPPLFAASRSSVFRIAEMLAKATSQGPGTYSVMLHPESSAGDTGERYRIHDATDSPVLDVYRYDYLPRLRASASTTTTDSGTSAKAADVVQRMVFFFRSLALLIPGIRRAKKPIAKWQIGVGVIAIGVMALAVIFAALALLAALGVISGSADFLDSLKGADAYSIGALISALAVFLLTVVRPKVLVAGNAIAELITYADDERRAVTVYTGLAEMIDALLEEDSERKIHLLGYSFGAVVAVDYLFPRKLMHDIVVEPDGTLDARISQLQTLSTVGCPLDMLRVYFPRYLEERVARKDRLNWLNIFNAADVLASNFAYADDLVEETPNEEPVDVSPQNVSQKPEPRSHLSIAGERRKSVRYTSHKLTVRRIFQGYGFLTHRSYWGEPEEANCLHLVARHIGLGPEGHKPC